MFTLYRWCSAAAATTAAALFLGASPANAVPAPEPTDEAVCLQTCPKIDTLAQWLRASGFSSQAAQNYAILTQRDCLNEI
jgi:hypothetical protein